MHSREEMYIRLVEARKLCRRPECRPLCNQSEIDGGVYDYNQIGSWSLWQGNLNSKIVVVGRDWGSIADFRTLEGYPTSGIGISKTNRTLIQLLQSIGITIGECERGRVGGPLFFTNSILCIQPGKRSDPVKQVWANLCSKAFLRPLLDLIAPEIVITLSAPAYFATLAAFDVRSAEGFASAVGKEQGIQLTNSSVLFPMYHPAARPKDRNREQQLVDWMKIALYMERIRLQV